MIRYAALAAGSCACLLGASAASAQAVEPASEATGGDLSDLSIATLWKDCELEPGRADLARGDSLGHDPEYQLLARSHFDLADRVQLNVGLRRVGDIEAAPGISSYVEADARLASQVSGNLDLYLAGRNLLHRNHAESDDPQRGQLAERSLHAGSRVRF